MQIMINLHEETPEALQLAAKFLSDHAALLKAMGQSGQTVAPNVPLAPVAPPAPTAMVPGTFTASLTSAPAPVAPPAPVVPVADVPTAANFVSTATAGVIPPPMPVMPAVDEFDSSGIPYDARIHQRGKAKKKDGTWKLQKGIADVLVSQVMQELAPRIRKVPLPPTVEQGSNIAINSPAVPAPAVVAAAPVIAFGQTPLPPGVEPAPVPPAPIAPIAPPAPPAAPLPPVETVSPFRALVQKITTARDSGRITIEEINTAIANAGAPSLQLVNNMPHLIPQINANIDALLVTR